MKNLFMILCSFFLFVGVSGMAKGMNDGQIRGKIKDFTGGDVMVIYYVGQEMKVDTLQVSDAGVFVYDVKIDEPSRAFLVFENYGCSVDLFLESGMDADLDISFHTEKYEESDIYVPDVTYTGDNADCYHFMRDSDGWEYESWPFERLDTMSFADYREGYLENVDQVKSDLMKVKSPAFKRMMVDMIDQSIPANLFRHAWSKPREDADFVRWVEAFDRNDPDNMEMAERYVRWYLQRHPAGKEQNRVVYHLNALTQIFTNQEIINDMANSLVDYYLKQAPKDMTEVFEVYKRVSTDTVDHSEMQKVYDHYINMMPGAPAIDFEMTDVNGKKCHLSDFKGKAVYIDVWATWCGPCCMEIPYMEKLVKHYAKNKKIEFLSISLDENQKKWKKKLTEDKPEWKQFICPDNFQSTLCQEYDIDGIPRFLFFDKKGKIISLDAPRPSSSKIIEYIDQHINR